MAHRQSALTAVLCLAIAGCAAGRTGVAVPATRPAPTTAETLPALLLSAGDVATALGSAELAIRSRTTAPWDDRAQLPGTDTGCLAVTGAAQRAAYADSGWVALRGQTLRESPAAPAWSHFATQAVALFSDDAAAAAFLAGSGRSWAGCADRELRYVQQPAPDQVWIVGPAAVAGSLLTVSREQRSPQHWFCQRALTTRGSVAVDVEACHLGAPTSSAVAMARTIADRLSPRWQAWFGCGWADPLALGAPFNGGSSGPSGGMADALA